MERNSRDFERRIHTIDANTEVVCDFLRSQSKAGGASSAVLKDVFYPKWVTRDKYERYRTNEGGFGGLFSLTFTSGAASQAFFNALQCHKGPSLGTNFTLACPYTILAHYYELDWASEFGVEEGLVRVSVGLEDQETLLGWFNLALAEAEGTS
jgi:cystathionine gamma-synthase